MKSVPEGMRGSYRIFGAGGAPLGGMLDKPEGSPLSGWIFYVDVDGLDAASSGSRPTAVGC